MSPERFCFFMFSSVKLAHHRRAYWTLRNIGKRYGRVLRSCRDWNGVRREGLGSRSTSCKLTESRRSVVSTVLSGLAATDRMARLCSQCFDEDSTSSRALSRSVQTVISRRCPAPRVRTAPNSSNRDLEKISENT